MLRHLINPNKCAKMEELSHTIELWEEQLRLYEQRKRADGTRHTLDEEIKISVLEHLCPSELERHLQLNRARYVTYQDVRDEVSLYLETRLGAKLKVGTAAQPSDESAPMDIGAFDKGGKKGKGKGKDGKGKNKGQKGKGKRGKSSFSGQGAGKGSRKEDRKCHNCGKIGHLQKDCWSAGGGAANKGQSSKGKPKNSSKGGKGVGSLENNEPEAEAAETGFLSIAGLENVEVKEEEKDLPCVEPCDDCFHHRCAKGSAEAHSVHQCNLCSEEHAKLEKESMDKNTSKTKIRNELKWKKPEFFNYVVDKTICLVKGMSSESFDDLSESKKEELRSVHDPSKTSRDSNRDILQKIESAREDYRIAFFERLAWEADGWSESDLWSTVVSRDGGVESSLWFGRTPSTIQTHRCIHNAGNASHG